MNLICETIAFVPLFLQHLDSYFNTKLNFAFRDWKNEKFKEPNPYRIGLFKFNKNEVINLFL